jgi:hypothetical protein
MLFPNIPLTQNFSIDLKGGHVHVQGIPVLADETRSHEVFGDLGEVFRRLVAERRALKSRLNHIDHSILSLSRNLEPEDL